MKLLSFLMLIMLTALNAKAAFIGSYNPQTGYASVTMLGLGSEVDNRDSEKLFKAMRIKKADSFHPKKLYAYPNEEEFTFKLACTFSAFSFCSLEALADESVEVKVQEGVAFLQIPGRHEISKKLFRMFRKLKSSSRGAPVYANTNSTYLIYYNKKEAKVVFEFLLSE